MMLSRRGALRAFAGLGLAACDASRPKRGILGLGERANERVQSALLGDHEVAAGDITPADAFPVYHVAPGIPTAPPGWRLLVTGDVERPLSLDLDDLHEMSRTEARIEHHCVEGWSAIATWTGVRLSELAKRAGARDTEYVNFRSFDIPRGGNVGYASCWDRESAMHPQTMVAYGMNGAPLAPAHGAPVRIYAAVKLGYKQVKYLTEIQFVSKRLGGYWEDQGYEWFAGV